MFAYVYNCLNDSVKALLIAWNSKAFALTGRVEPTCETSVNHVFLKENLFLSKSTAKEEVCTVGLLKTDYNLKIFEFS